MPLNSNRFQAKRLTGSIKGQDYSANKAWQFSKPLHSKLSYTNMVSGSTLNFLPEKSGFEMTVKCIDAIAIPMLGDWLKSLSSQQFFNQWEANTKNQSFLVGAIFPAPSAGYKQLLGIVIGWSRCFLLLWLVGVITLVLVLWQSFQSVTSMRKNVPPGNTYVKKIHCQETISRSVQLPHIPVTAFS